MRKRVMKQLAPGAQRRVFWEKFVDLAFGLATGADDNAATTRLIDEVASGTSATGGRVTLVGAGPGDAELLTMKAVRALQAADVILFDDLVSDDVLELARREAKRMLVGKRGKRASCRQDDINDLVIKLARQGKHVVRLKSGDPMIFGRAGEEIARLQAANIKVDAVPGITTAAAMASALGVSLTHRHYAHSVRFVTGHARNGELPTEIDWRGLADPETTTIIYMGGRTCRAIAERLMAEGLAPSTPSVIVTAVSRADERRWTGSLCDLANGGAVVDVEQPILIGIGCVFATLAVSCALNAPHNSPPAQSPAASQ